MSLLIFDLDGVLVDTKDIHYEALNKALPPDCQISYEDHLNKYDGLSTRKKLDMLVAEGRLRPDEYSRVNFDKQMYTATQIGRLQPDRVLQYVLATLKKQGHTIAVASNSIRDTVFNALKSLGIIRYIDYIVSNEDVKSPKPSPEMYWQIMTKFEHDPDDTYIFEDSSVGRAAARKSGANLVPVRDRSDITLKFVHEALTGKIPTTPWIDSRMNVLIPMAGLGSRFADAGYTFPKPLIEVNGKPMIQAVVENLNIKANYIYVVQQEHAARYNLRSMLSLITPGCTVISVYGTTDGAARTTLLADEYIDNSDPLLIANSDQIVEWDANETMYSFMSSRADAGMLTFKALHPKWSYARIENGWVTEVAEKNPISDNATAGIYYWKRGADYVHAAEKMIAKDIRTKGEFYVAPVFNEAISLGLKVRATQIEKMWGIGTPEDLNYYLEHHA